MSTPPASSSGSLAGSDPAHPGSEAVTRGFRVTVTPRYLPEESAERSTEAWRGRGYVFAYQIRVANEGDIGAQLISRHWVIIDADGEREEVRGEGVVGAQPHLAPGEAFEYSSFCPLSTPWGTMEGTYLMESDEGEKFPIAVGRFYLVAPRG